jgi:hypothetical protein
MRRCRKGMIMRNKAKSMIYMTQEYSELKKVSLRAQY